ncbi:MAG: hypothetical protein NVSMB6_20440 [Burkholderiaceae bacterium]
MLCVSPLHMKKTFGAAAMLACAIHGAYAGALSAPEAALIAAVRARSPAALQLLEKSVNINSRHPKSGRRA